MDASYGFARSFVNTKFEDLPQDAVEVTRREILDILGVALGGSGKPGVKELLELVTDWGGKEESTIFCYGNKVPAPNAAQVNATMSHALDYDDTGSGPTHPSVAIVPTCLALAERKGGLSGKELITAVALGVDMMCRLGLGFRRVMETMPPDIRETLPGKTQPAAGWHLTPLYAFISSAGAAGRILGLDEERMVNALGIGYHQSAGNGQCVLDGAMTKRMGPGFAARGGLMAALMAEKGITGAPNVFQGEDGLFNVYHRNNLDAKFLTADLGKRFEGVNVTMKPYPCCAGTHGYVAATFSLIEKHGIKAEDVGEIIITSRAGDVLCVPLEVRSRPRNPVDSQFSVPWAVAAVIARGRAGIGEFNEEAIHSADILDIAGKIRLEEIPDTAGMGNTNPLKVEIKMKNGQTFSENTGNPLGAGGILPYSDYERKFRDCASYAARKIPDKNIDMVVELIGRLEELNDVTEIVELVSSFS
jgi:2-methylcitrate dehydratase PrpD